MSDDVASRRLWATKGETVVCTRSRHPICDIARDLYEGDAHGPQNFTNWRQPEPTRDTPITRLRCALCRSVWVRQGSKGPPQLYFAEGWR